MKTQAKVPLVWIPKHRFMAHQDQTVGVVMTAAKNYRPSETVESLLRAKRCSRCANQ